jgi:hypothetical protein
MTHSGHASRRSGAIPWTRNGLRRGIEMTLLCSSQMDFALGPPLPPSIRGETVVRQSVACSPAPRGENCAPALSEVVCHSLNSLGDLVAPGPEGTATASLQPLLCCGPAKLRSAGLLTSNAAADWGHALSQLHPSVHTRLKVSSCAVLTQSRNSGNNLQLSEKSFDGWKLRLREFRRRRATALSVEQ